MTFSFYDKNGRAYAYSDDGVHIYTYVGKPIGYIHDESIYSISGKHIGYFNKGSLLDANGNTLLFTEKSSSGPLKPIRQLKPIKGIKQIMPIKGIRQIRPIKPITSLGWSSQTPESIFE
ncbi:hypothetical protein GCM10007161_05240 [Ignatzschineria indica]|uniref:4-fold beta flower domain-containing protein n=1 Tax=Ignatzschineria indica TaxID=472583 RepID=A0A2U2AMR7_9GAMM|nr:hypothetical protein [Ignatzschineria indica]PWD84513.1 hypothetical protein DC082_02955 [Ignatzschineria indica]GGZ77044.1 hypothetical protein GCM10007161_05240 [Ignatzschineria indica]